MNGRRAVVVIVFVTLAVFGFFFWTSNARWRPADVTHAQIVPEHENRIELHVSACNADLAADVRENDQAIAVRVSKRNEWDGDCAGAIVITISDPIGERVLVDLSDWQQVAFLH